MVMVLAATVKAPWRWCRSRPSFSHWVFDSLRPNDKVLPRSRLWRPRSTSRPAADGLRKQLNTYARHSPSPQMGRRTGSCRAPLSLAFKCFNSLYGRSLHIGQVELQAHHERLPQYDDDQFMIELAALPDQDGVEEQSHVCVHQAPSCNHVCVRIAPSWWALP